MYLGHNTRMGQGTQGTSYETNPRRLDLYLVSFSASSPPLRQGLWFLLLPFPDLRMLSLNL